jgi:hypothetical protein
VGEVRRVAADLKTLAQDLEQRGKLDLSECFIDGTFVTAKKGGQQLRRLLSKEHPGMEEVEGSDLEVDPSLERGEGFDLSGVERQRSNETTEARLDTLTSSAHPALPIACLRHVLTLWVQAEEPM